MIDDCPNDPNLKTSIRMDQLDNELERLLEIKDAKKLFANSIILTTHMLKNCVKVPKLYE